MIRAVLSTLKERELAVAAEPASLFFRTRIWNDLDEIVVRDTNAELALTHSNNFPLVIDG